MIQINLLKVLMVAFAVKAKTCYIYIRGEHYQENLALDRVISEA